MRYGGEEFLAVLPGAGESDVRVLGERLRRVVEESLTTAGSVEIRVTVSLGAISFPSVDATDLDDLIRRADSAMYEAKKAGRNRLAFA
jgi:diguanylate cyclase (GGDEF)-like protein